MFRGIFASGTEAMSGAVTASGCAQEAEQIDAQELTPSIPEGVFVSEGRTHCASGVVEVAGQALKWTLEAPEVLKSDSIAGFVPGFGGFKGTSKAPTHAMAEAGIPSFRYAPLRKDDRRVIERLGRVQDAHVLTIEKVVEALSDKKNLSSLPNADQLDPKRLWLVMHSMGGEAGTRFAQSNTSIVEGASYLATVGFGSPTPAQLVMSLVARGPGALRHELRPYATSGNIDPTIASLMQAIQHYSTNPLRTIGEIGSCLTSDLVEPTIVLRDAGVNTAYFKAFHDVLVRPGDEIAELFRHYYLLKDAGHLFPQLKNRLLASLIRHQMQR